MEIGLVQKIDINEEMRQSFLDYAMSVIVARALPDARDGLKPVQRRILYSMYDMGLRPEHGFRKSARIVGDVLGKYHPHGDVAVYEAMARMAQDFSMRYPMVDGQGNFGSVDGDPPAAMRYTEAKLKPYAIELISQLDRDTVDFGANFDETLKEPLVLPAALPNLLMNGASGIAVGMATNIPPHNLAELYEAMKFMLSNWTKLDDIDVMDLMEFVKGPDFPTGGIIMLDEDQSELRSAYTTGKGRITVRGRVQIEEMSRGRNRIIITELPYMTNKASLIERIAGMARDGKLDGISDLRDESDRQGMRIVIDLTKSGDAEALLLELYKRTPLQNTFGITILALVNSEPKLLSLKQSLKVYLDHRIEVIIRRSKYDLRKAKEREHILEGLRVAINNINKIISLIRKSRNTETARNGLMKEFKLSEIQANAILDMALKRISSLERKKIETEYKEIVAKIKQLEKLLKSPKQIRSVVLDELTELNEKYSDIRKTQIVSMAEGESTVTLLTASDLIPAVDCWVGINPENNICKTDSDKLPRISGKNSPFLILKTNSRFTLAVPFTNGEGVTTYLGSIPSDDKLENGSPIRSLFPVNGENLAAGIFSFPSDLDQYKESYFLTVSRKGMVKKSSILDLPGPTANAFTMVKVNTDDEIIRVLLTNGNDDIVLLTARGMMIRFSEEDVRPMGLVAAGVNGIKLSNDDFIVAADVIHKNEEILTVTADGTGWRIPEKQLPKQGRYGQGVIAGKLREGNEFVGAMVGKKTQTGVIHFEKFASRKIRLDQIEETKRNTFGKPVIEVSAKDSVFQLSYPIDHLQFWKNRAK